MLKNIFLLFIFCTAAMSVALDASSIPAIGMMTPLMHAVKKGMWRQLKG